MKRHANPAWLRFACVLMLAGDLGLDVFGKTCTWINTETASAQDWTVAANWDCGNVPASGDDVVITNAAHINFADANLGSVLHTAGDLKLAAASATPLTLNGDFTTRGKTVYNYAKIVLTEGEHVLSNTCSFVLCNGQDITGAGSLVKTGAGEVKGNGWDGNLKLTFTGKLTIRQGAFSTGVICEWTGAANTTWANAANWKDGRVPSSLDSVILAADAPNAPASVPAQAFHDFINRIAGLAGGRSLQRRQGGDADDGERRSERG